MPDVPLPLSSLELHDAAVVRGDIVLASEEVEAPQSGLRFVRRTYEVHEVKVLRTGAQSAVPGSLIISGSKLVGPDEPLAEALNPTLWLEGHRFFAQPVSGQPEPVLLLLGAVTNPVSELRLIPEAVVQGGSWDGRPVRPFLLRGADRPLDAAILELWGFHSEEAVPDRLARALEAAHPLIAIDALRVATVDSEVAQQVTPLVEKLLHPSQPAVVKAESLRTVNRFWWRLPQGSSQADALARALYESWSSELRADVHGAYVDVFTRAAELMQHGADIASLVEQARQLEERLQAQVLQDKLVSAPPAGRRGKRHK